MWSRSGCRLLVSSDEDAYVKLNSRDYERSAQRLRSTAARRIMQRDKDVPFLVPSGVCICARLLCIARPKNGFVDIVTRVHGHTMFAECLPMRPGSLLLYGPVFHSGCCCFAGIRDRVAAIWVVRVEMDW